MDLQNNEVDNKQTTINRELKYLVDDTTNIEEKSIVGNELKYLLESTPNIEQFLKENMPEFYPIFQQIKLTEKSAEDPQYAQYAKLQQNTLNFIVKRIIQTKWVEEYEI